ncbi:hypothetical protein [Paraburkholderia sp. BCC1886]|uniref:hypothetical protein n=1 Tax=Paraburkholderia sp. BCC1886 TaxID=2562670 RepID=UPI00164303AC|nr:hypothetical protein [Paraburkholderia sp. BCC1886]
MIRMMKAVAVEGGSKSATAARAVQHQQAAMMRKVVGFAILTSGLAVIAAQAVQHALGG